MSLIQTRGDAKTFAKNLLDERGNTFFSSTLQNNFVDEANHQVWMELIKSNHEYFNDTASLAYTADSESVDIQSATTSTPHRIIDIGHTPLAGAVSPSNRFNQWRPMRFRERFQIQQQFTTGNYHWVLMANELYVAPIPTSNLNVKLTYIAPLASMTDDANNLLAGVAHQIFGDAVAYCLAHLMNTKQHKENPQVESLWYAALERIRDNAISRDAEETGHVRVTRHPWE